MSDQTPSSDHWAQPPQNVLTFRQLLLRDAVAHSAAPRFLLSLFDSPEGESEAAFDAMPFGLSSGDARNWQIPATATIHAETSDGARWAHLICGLRATNGENTVYLSALLDERGLRAAYRDDEGHPEGDEDTFAELPTTGVVPMELVTEFTERLGLSATPIPESAV